MKRDDLISMGTSIGLHVLLLILFGLMSLGAQEPEPLGYIEVDFGPIAEGRPVQRAEVDEPEAPEQQQQPEREQPEPKAAPPKDAKPVDLPDAPEEVVDEQKVQTPETEKISPLTQNSPAVVNEPEPNPEPAPRPLGGARDGTTGAVQGAEGPSQDEQRTAPFQIEGLNRSTLSAPLPPYADKVNADIRVRITVDPQGRIIGVVPVLKANPALERAIEDVLRNQWRFNPLPPNAPRENQIGTVTFRFRLE